MRLICKDASNGEILVELFLSDGKELNLVEVIINDSNKFIVVDERNYIGTTYNELYHYIYKYLKIDLSNIDSFIIEEA